MTWQIRRQTGELIGPDGTVHTTLEGPPYRVPDDAQQWAASEFRALTMADITTDMLADFAQLWVGDVEVIE